jgi:hypothetical protein
VALGAPPTNLPRLPGRDALDGVIETSEAALATILDAVDSLQDAIEDLRAEGASHRTTHGLARPVERIVAACEFGDIATQSHRKLARALRLVEGRLQALAERLGVEAEPELSLLATVERSMSQDDIDLVFVERELSVAAVAANRPVTLQVRAEKPAFEPPKTAAQVSEPPVTELVPVERGRPERPCILPPGPACADPPPVRVRTLADIDALSAPERLRLFT